MSKDLGIFMRKYRFIPTLEFQKTIQNMARRMFVMELEENQAKEDYIAQGTDEGFDSQDERRCWVESGGGFDYEPSDEVAYNALLLLREVQ